MYPKTPGHRLHQVGSDLMPMYPTCQRRLTSAVSQLLSEPETGHRSRRLQTSGGVDQDDVRRDAALPRQALLVLHCLLLHVPAQSAILFTVVKIIITQVSSIIIIIIIIITNTVYQVWLLWSCILSKNRT